MKKITLSLLFITLFSMVSLRNVYADLVVPLPGFEDSGVSTNDKINHQLLLASIFSYILINITIESFVFILMSLRNRRHILALVIANLISVPIALYMINSINLILVEILVVIFETLVFKTLIKDLTFTKAFKAALFANAVSLFLGLFVSIFVGSIFYFLIDSNLPTPQPNFDPNNF